MVIRKIGFHIQKKNAYWNDLIIAHDCEELAEMPKNRIRGGKRARAYLNKKAKVSDNSLILTTQAGCFHCNNLNCVCSKLDDEKLTDSESEVLKQFLNHMRAENFGIKGQNVDKKAGK